MTNIGNSSINDLLKNQNNLDTLNLKISNISSNFTTFENVFTNINKSFGLFSSNVNEISQSLTDINKASLNADSSFTKLGKTFSTLNSISNEKPKLDSISRSFYNLLMQDANVPKWRVPDDIRNEINRTQSPLKGGNLGPFYVDQGISIADELIPPVSPGWRFLYNTGKWGAKTGNIAANSDSQEDLLAGLGQLGAEFGIDKFFAYLATKYKWGASIGPGLVLSMATTFEGHGEENRKIQEEAFRKYREEEEEKRKKEEDRKREEERLRNIEGHVGGDEPYLTPTTFEDFYELNKDIFFGPLPIPKEELDRLIQEKKREYYKDKISDNFQDGQFGSSAGNRYISGENSDPYSFAGRATQHASNKGVGARKKEKDPVEVFEGAFGEVQKIGSSVISLMSTLNIGSHTFVGELLTGFNTAVSVIGSIVSILQAAQSAAGFFNFLGSALKIGSFFTPAGAATAAIPLASGGSVPGFGDTDSIPAMLTPGEFVVKKSIVNKFGSGFFEWINGGGLTNSLAGHYSGGGLIAGARGMHVEFAPIEFNVRGDKLYGVINKYKINSLNKKRF
ncbi:MAG: hypothetical protein J0M18_09025 [Ignavibacteria bacterium]|nr:hypothetical protein [Ignavibacteria bacterium]